MKEEVNYHLSRIMFAELLDGNLVLASSDPRGHNEWLKQDYLIDDEEFKRINRGYIKNNRIVFYKGNDFEEINIEDIESIIIKLNQKYNINVYDYEIWSGVKPGEIGQEWGPIRILSIEDINNKNSRIKI